MTQWVVVQKIYSERHSVSCTNTHQDVGNCVNYGMVKNTKTWIPWERNITFSKNKKILNLCHRWQKLFFCSRGNLSTLVLIFSAINSNQQQKWMFVKFLSFSLTKINRI